MLTDSADVGTLQFLLTKKKKNRAAGFGAAMLLPACSSQDGKPFTVHLASNLLCPNSAHGRITDSIQSHGLGREQTGVQESPKLKAAALTLVLTPGARPLASDPSQSKSYSPVLFNATEFRKKRRRRLH